MPEGPEIRRAADRIAAVLVGRKVCAAELTMPSLQQFRRQVVGANVVAVDTHGKAMLTRFDNGLTLYSHNQLYGRWYVTRREQAPKTNRSLRVALHTDQHSAWLFSASDVQMLDDDGVRSHPFLIKLGPDILDPALRPTDVCNRLGEPRFRRRNLAGLYLDQSFLAGIGNYLRSEILFSAGVDPSSRPSDLSRPSRMRIARATLRVSRRAYELGGVTVTRKMSESLQRSGRRYAEYRHWVFGRDGEPCRRCGTSIERQSIAGRSLFVCDSCQSRR